MAGCVEDMTSYWVTACVLCCYIQKREIVVSVFITKSAFGSATAASAHPLHKTYLLFSKSTPVVDLDSQRE